MLKVLKKVKSPPLPHKKQLHCFKGISMSLLISELSHLLPIHCLAHVIHFFPISYSSWNRENPAISPWQESKHPLERDVSFKCSFHIYNSFSCKGSKLTNAEENWREVLFTWPRIAKTLVKNLILWLSLASYLNNLVWGAPHRFFTSIYRSVFIYRAYTC